MMIIISNYIIINTIDLFYICLRVCVTPNLYNINTQSRAHTHTQAHTYIYAHTHGHTHTYTHASICTYTAT